MENFKLGEKTDIKLLSIKVLDDALNSVSSLVDRVPYKAQVKSWFGWDDIYILKFKTTIPDLCGVDADDDDCPVNAYNAPPFISVSFGGERVSTHIGDRSWFSTTTPVIRDSTGVYIVYVPHRKHESIINLLTILLVSGHKEVVELLKKVIFDGMNKIFSVNTDKIELAGVDDLIKKCMNVLESNDPRLVNRHILLAGIAGCGKSELMKELVKRTPDWVHYSLQGNTKDWSEFMRSLNKIMVFIGKRVMILADEIDEIGLTRDKDFSKVYELLRVMDGVSEMGNIKFVATTNRPADLDPALKRVGRFSPIIIQEAPDEARFKKIVEFYAKRYGGKVNADKIAKIRDNAVGADIRASFEDCIIQKEPITTENMIKNLVSVMESKKIETKNYT